MVLYRYQACHPRIPCHVHGPGCGHTAVQHGDRTDYLHDRHLNNVYGDHVDEHAFEISAQNPPDCTPQMWRYGKSNVHGPNRGHEPVPHGEHCDDHGEVQLASLDGLRDLRDRTTDFPGIRAGTPYG